jgi:hypothetical protein
MFTRTSKDQTVYKYAEDHYLISKSTRLKTPALVHEKISTRGEMQKPKQGRPSSGATDERLKGKHHFTGER